jgi:hypothetical protein
MERANESGKRCAEIILKKYSLDYDRTRYATTSLPNNFVVNLIKFIDYLSFKCGF